LVGLDPIGGNAPLGFLQIQLTAANQAVGNEFKVIFLISAPSAFSGLRPHIAGVTGVAANAQGNQVVLFVISGVGVAVAVLANLFAL
jgi:hypothetical protein